MQEWEQGGHVTGTTTTGSPHPRWSLWGPSGVRPGPPKGHLTPAKRPAGQRDLSGQLLTTGWHAGSHSVWSCPGLLGDSGLGSRAPTFPASPPLPSRTQLGAMLPPGPEAGSSHSCSNLPMAGQWDLGRLSAQADSTQHVPTSGRACTPTTHVTSLIALQGSQPTENSRGRGSTTSNILLSRKFTLLILSERTNGNRISRYFTLHS